MNNIEFLKIELENKEIEKSNSDMIGYKKKINKVLSEARKIQKTM